MLRVRWLNLVLSLTNKIYQQKQELLVTVGIRVIGKVILLFFQEIILGVISLPLYLGLKSSKVTAYFEEKGGYDKISFDYGLRKIITLTGVSVIIFIWLIKLGLIILTPAIWGPLQLYSVSDLRPVDLIEQELLITETQIQTARIVDKMSIPQLIGVDKLRGGDYRFHGIGQPDALVVLLISDIQTIILTENIGKDGNWQVDLIREEFKLSEGNHQIIAFNFDSNQQIRSQASSRQYFKVKTTAWDIVARSADIFINISIIVVIFLGILLTILTV